MADALAVLDFFGLERVERFAIVWPRYFARPEPAIRRPSRADPRRARRDDPRLRPLPVGRAAGGVPHDGGAARRLESVSFLPRLAVAWAINAAALWVANALWDGVRIHGWAAYLIGAAVLGVANTVLKPVLALLTLPLIIVTLGFFYLVINIAMVALAEWVSPRFSIDGFWSYVGVVVVVWVVNWIGHEVADRIEEGTRRPRPIWR